jgi:ribosomal-protein-alanine N-acetyltransferase
MHPPEVLETIRLRLRQLVEEDGPVIFDRWAQDTDITRFLVWRPHESVDESFAFGRRCVASWNTAANFTWIMEDPASGCAVGAIGAYPSDHAVELGYVMARDSWGHGYMVEAVDAVSKWFLSQPSVARIWAEVDVENLASARVLEKASFEREGLLRRSIMCPNISSEPRDAFVFGRIR